MQNLISIQLEIFLSRTNAIFFATEVGTSLFNMQSEFASTRNPEPAILLEYA